MALQGSGAISLDDMHVEAGGTTGTQCSLNDSDIRAMISKADGAQASFSEYYNAASTVDIALTIASNTNNYNIFSNKGGSYVAGKSNVTVTINSGVTVGSTSTGTYALETGSGWASGDTITIVNNGSVRGRGGNGANGGTATYPNVTNGGNGGSGGNAFRAQFATTITNNGTFAGGGGGGGGGGSYTSLSSKDSTTTAAGGGGGGGGAGTSSGGSGGAASGANNNYSGTNGAAGTATAGGTYGGGSFNERGGAGGGAGSAGETPPNLYTGNTQNSSNGSGGARGNYAVGNSNITWSVTGTRQGGVS